MADSGSIMGEITRNAEGTASGVRAATTAVVVTGGSQRASGNQTHSTSDARVAQLRAGGDMTLIANGGSITSQGAQLSAEGDALLLATKDIVFDVAHNTESSTSQSSGKGWGLATNTSGLPVGTNNSRSEGTGQSDTITGTQLSVGGGVRMATTEGDITLTAANIAAEKDVTIRAAGNLTVQSGQDTVSNANTADSKAIGTVQISDTERFAGWHRQQHEDDSGMVSQVASTIGSLGGNVNLGAGGKYTQVASNVVAAQDVNITAAEIELLTADESGYNSQSDKDLKIGVFARVKSPFIDLINNVDAARQSDGRLQAMQGMAAGANAYQAGSAIANAASKGAAGSGALFSAEAGIGFKSSSSSADGSSTVSRGSTIQGGGNVNLTSTSGDIHVVQGNLSAGNTLALDSAGDILLEAGKAHLQDKSKSNNAGAEVGVGVSVGAQTGVYVYAEASVGSSKSNSESSTWQNTTLTGQNISLKAEGDTTLRGATATADRIDVKTGGTLTIESLQDIAESMSKDSQVGGRVQVSFGTAWDASGYASANKANGSYKGVGQQSGLFAGDGGYHVDAGHVNLIGGAIASTNGANSELTAESFTFTDLKNEMDYRASSASISGGFGSGGEKATDANGNPAATPNAAGQFKDIGSNVANGKFGNADGSNFSGGVPMTSSGSDSSTTYATLTEGTITIGGKKVTAAELGVNTDASKAHEAISTLPDLQKLMQEQQAMSSAAGTVLVASKQIAGDVFAYKSKTAQQEFEKSLASRDPDEWARYDALDQKGKDAYLTKHSTAYYDAKDWGTGGKYSRAIDAVTTAIVGGVAGQAGTQVAANALAPYAANFVGTQFDPNHGSDPNATLQLISHAVLGALLAEANGSSAGNGAVAAVGGELAAKYLTDILSSGNPEKLDDEQKQTILALSQAIGALAGGMGAEGLAGAALGANLAQNAVKNNYLSHPERMEYLDALLSCSETGTNCDIRDSYEALSAERDKALIMACQVSGSALCTEQRSLLQDAYGSHTWSAYGTEYQDWLDKIGDRLIAASEKAGSGFDLALVSLHASTEDVQLKLYCSLVGECGSNTPTLLRAAGYNAEADWLDKKNFVVGATGFAEGFWDRGVDSVMGLASLSPVGQLMNMGNTFADGQKAWADVSANGYWATVGKRGGAALDSFSKSINAYMEESAAAAYYFSGGRNNWSFTDLEGVAQFSGKLTFDAGSMVIGPETLLLKQGAAAAKVEAALARETALVPASEGGRVIHLWPDEIVGDGLIDHLPTIKYPDGMKFNSNLEAHLGKVDGFTQKNRISGGHNAVEFKAEVVARGIKINSETPTGVPGVTQVRYQIPALDNAGNVTGLKVEEFTKTIYDPALYSDRKILTLGQQAAASGYEQAVKSGVGAYDAKAGGITFRVYIDTKTGEVRNVHPK